MNSDHKPKTDLT